MERKLLSGRPARQLQVEPRAVDLHQALAPRERCAGAIAQHRRDKALHAFLAMPAYALWC